MASPVGTLLSDRYRLDAQVGAGGMSTVYRAFDTVLERDVAIKLMHREIASDSDQLERFRRESRAVAQFNHPHVVGVIDAGEDEGTPYIVFEFVEGETLKERIRRQGRLPVPEAVAYAIEIARALQVAHERQIVHRDVKPQNVLIDVEGSAKVTDFGIARSLDQDGLTADGRVLGTTDYVSPEQALGHRVGPQSDLYSLGVVLFEMLTGDVPFKGENQVAVAMKHVREELPDLQLRRPEVSAELAAVLDRATAKDLSLRHPDAASLIAELEDALATETARAGQATGEATAILKTLPRRTRRRLPLRMRVRVGAVVALLLAGLVGAVVLLVLSVDQTERGTGRQRSVAPAPPGEREVPLGQRRANDYDPAGDDDEHADEVAFVLDDEPATTWSTETYDVRALRQIKPGVGIYVDAKPGVAASRLEVTTTTPGWTGAVYGARRTVPEGIVGWQRLATIPRAKRRERLDLDTAGNRFRYYLVWITALPAGRKVALNEIVLFRRG